MDQSKDTRALPVTIEDFLAQQKDKDLVRIIICGSSDDGASALINCLSRKSVPSFSHPTPALSSESREAIIGGNVAYHRFASTHRQFIIADTAGHAQHVRNLVTAASNADVAVLLVDIQSGLTTQTRHHAYLCALMGIKHLALAVNQMDRVRFPAEPYTNVVERFHDFAKALGFASVTAIPLSALKGDNITTQSANMRWYNGPTLISYLDSVPVAPAQTDRLVFPVQWVSQPNAPFWGLSGTIAEGQVRTGDSVRVTASGQQATVTEIVTMDGALQVARAGEAVTLRLDRTLQASRGDIIALANAPLETTDQFEATVVWMHEEEGLTGRTYDISLSTQSATASITLIKHRIDTDTLAHDAAKTLALNDISSCNIASSKPLVFDTYTRSKTLGSFILIDRYSHATVAAGVITHSLRRAQNVHKQALSITRTDREKLNVHPAKVIWFTGLSGSGKSTLANALEVALYSKGMRTYILDGDNIRQGLNRDLGFTDADRVENIRRIAEVARLMMDAGVIVMTAFISPFKREREMARELIGAENFIEVYVSTPLTTCEQRDVKGLYKKARAGKIPNMTGINSPYEMPDAASYVADCDNAPLDKIVEELIELVSPGFAADL